VSFTLLPAAGQVIRASVLEAAIAELRPLQADKTSDTSRNTTVVRVADPDLTLALPANSTWEYTLMLILNSAANAAGDFSGEMAFPSGAVHAFGSHGVDIALPSGQSADLSADSDTRDATSPSADFGVGCSTLTTSVFVHGRVEIGATPGSLTLNWAQNTSNANNTTVQDGSFMVAHRIE
jgi:hypothetical protein